MDTSRGFCGPNIVWGHRRRSEGQNVGPGCGRGGTIVGFGFGVCGGGGGISLNGEAQQQMP